MKTLPNGFRVAGVASGIKSTAAEDVTLIVADKDCVAAGVYTKNQVVAAPVVLDRARTPSSNIRAVVINSGNANACTGNQGMQNAKRMTQVAARELGCSEEQVLVMSTGIIGEHLPMPQVESGISAAAKNLGNSQAHFLAAARGILTTDTQIKTATYSASNYSLTGMSKGSGMIGPNMATMLGIVLTDATLDAGVAQQILAAATERSFNSINVDGHTSTNDTVVLLASGTGIPLTGDALAEFSQQFEEVCIDLAKQIVTDGEGATHLVEIVISGAASDQDAKMIAEAIANSPLVKTAFAGNDPNWGRIVSAAGYAGPKMDISNTSLRLNGTQLYQDGAPVDFDAATVAQEMEANRDILVELAVGKGTGTSRFWTCDLTHEYVTINAEYHT